MSDKYIAPYIPFAVVDPQTGRATGQFQAFWKSGLENAVAAAIAAEAAAVAAADAQTTATAAQGTAEAAQATADTKQPQSTSLTNLAALSGTGLVEQTGPNAFTDRAIGVGTGSSIPTRGDADARYVGQNGTAAPSYSAYGGQTMGAAYSQAQAQATDDAIKAASAALASVIAKLHSIGAFS
jgi:hypothetical protein